MPKETARQFFARTGQLPPGKPKGNPMAKAAVKETDAGDEQGAGIGHNSKTPEDQKAFILQCAKEMAEIDGARKKLNEKAGDIRGVLKDRGIDRDAFRDVYGYYKKRRHEKEGYDESHKLCFEALNAANTGDLFADLSSGA